MRGVLSRGSKLEDVTAEDFPLPHLGPVLEVIPVPPVHMQVWANISRYRLRAQGLSWHPPGSAACVYEHFSDCLYMGLETVSVHAL